MAWIPTSRRAAGSHNGSIRWALCSLIPHSHHLRRPRGPNVVAVRHCFQRRGPSTRHCPSLMPDRRSSYKPTKIWRIWGGVGIVAVVSLTCGLSSTSSTCANAPCPPRHRIETGLGAWDGGQAWPPRGIVPCINQQVEPFGNDQYTLSRSPGYFLPHPSWSPTHPRATAAGSLWIVITIMYAMAELKQLHTDQEPWPAPSSSGVYVAPQSPPIVKLAERRQLVAPAYATRLCREARFSTPRHDMRDAFLYHAAWPPSIRRSLPVIKLLASLRRKTADPRYSLGRLRRFSMFSLGQTSLRSG